MCLFDLLFIPFLSLQLISFPFRGNTYLSSAPYITTLAQTLPYISFSDSSSLFYQCTHIESYENVAFFARCSARQILVEAERCERMMNAARQHDWAMAVVFALRRPVVRIAHRHEIACER